MNSVSRRTIARGTAWSVPAIVLATSAPSASASVAGDALAVSACSVPVNLLSEGVTNFSNGANGTVDVTMTTGAMDFSQAAAQDPRINGYTLTPLAPMAYVLKLEGQRLSDNPDFVRRQIDGLIVSSTSTAITPIAVPTTLSLSGTVVVPEGSNYPAGSVCDNNYSTEPTTSTYVPVVSLGSVRADSNAPVSLLESESRAYQLDFYQDGVRLGGFTLSNTVIFADNGSDAAATPALYYSDQCGYQSARLQCWFPIEEGGGS